MNKYIFFFFNLLGVSVSNMSFVQTHKLCVNFRVHGSFFVTFKKAVLLWLSGCSGHEKIIVGGEWKCEIPLKVLSDATVAHGDDQKATAAAAEHVNTKVVLLEGILVKIIDILNCKNLRYEVAGISLSADFCQWNYVVLVPCRADLGLLSNL